MKHKKLVITGLILVMLLCSLTGILSILKFKDIPIKDENTTNITISDKTTKTQTTEISKENLNKLSDKQIEEYYEKGRKRFFVAYITSSDEEDFKKSVEKIVRLLVAYSEYQIDKYENLFYGTSGEDRMDFAIYIYEDFSKLQQISGQHKRYISCNASEFTYHMNCYFDLSIDISEDDIAITATHETTHLLQYSYSKNSTAGLPKWYREGQAEHYQSDPKYLFYKYQDIYNSYSYPKSIKDLENMFRSKTYEDLIFAYIVSEEFYSYLANIDERELVTLIESDYQTFPEKFKEIFNTSPESAYEDFLKEKS